MKGRVASSKKVSNNKLKPRSQDKPIGRFFHEKENPASALAVMEENQEDVCKVFIFK